MVGVTDPTKPLPPPMSSNPASPSVGRAGGQPAARHSPGPRTPTAGRDSATSRVGGGSTGAGGAPSRPSPAPGSPSVVRSQGAGVLKPSPAPPQPGSVSPGAPGSPPSHAVAAAVVAGREAGAAAPVPLAGTTIIASGSVSDVQHAPPIAAPSSPPPLATADASSGALPSTLPASVGGEAPPRTHTPLPLASPARYGASPGPLVGPSAAAATSLARPASPSAFAPATTASNPAAGTAGTSNGGGKATGSPLVNRVVVPSPVTVRAFGTTYPVLSPHTWYLSPT